MKNINETWHSITNTFNSMPFVIRYMTIFFLGGGFLFILVPLSPFGKFHIEDKEVSQAQFWVSGYGPGMLALGIVILIVGVGFIYRARWAKWLLYLLVLAPFVWQFIYYFILKNRGYEMTFVILYLIFLIYLFFYFFKKRTVCDYFEGK